MIRGSTLPRQALPMLAAAALLLLALVVLAVWFNANQDVQRTNVERDALATARQIVALSDAEALADSRQVQMIANSPAANDNDISRLTRFFSLALENNRHWKGLVMRNAETGQVMLEQGRGARGAADDRVSPPSPSQVASEGVFAQGRYCPCVVVRLPMAGMPRRTLTLYVDPAAFQQMVAQVHLPAGGVSALADRRGRFMARSLDYSNRVGRPGSDTLRAAVARGGTGIYRGVTLEGLENYTAYVTSPLTGWSGHVAVERSVIDNPRAFANAAVVLGVFAALVLAAGLLLYAVYEMRRRRIEEERLVGMQKAEAISRFTGTMAHDFRNILSVIDAGVRLIERHSGEPTTLQRAGAIGDAVERGNRLVNQLLSFVRGDGADVKPVDLQRCLATSDDLIERSLGEGIAFTWRVDEDARHALANADQLELALLNLAINARDAMDGTGTFSIVVEREGDWSAIHATDNGPGVPADLRKRIFEAFYSTKGDGKGTGLGLAQVAGAARQAGGRVELRDAPDGGACFSIYLPAAEVPGTAD